MRTSLWLTQLAGEFWQTAGTPEPFPRTLRAAIGRCAFDLSIKELPELCLGTVQRYLSQVGVNFVCTGPDRRLRACLSAYAGAGLILIDASDPPPQRTFSLAHELAHFLRHYWWPRQHARRRLGGQVLAVFDGQRSATPAEEVRALIAEAPLGLHVHLMERGNDGRIRSRAVRQAEIEADELAFELLAPAQAVSERAGPVRGAAGRVRVVRMLGVDFGLPPEQADAYAELLLPSVGEDPLLLRLRQ